MPHKNLLTNHTFYLKYKRITIYALCFVFAVTGHYFLMQISLDLFRAVRWSVISMLSCIGIGGSLMLIARKNGGRARTLFAIIMLIVGLTNLLSLIRGLTTGYAGVVQYKFLSLPMLVYGSMAAYLFLLYPIEAFRPGWLTGRRAIFLFLPTIIIPGIYLLLASTQHVSAIDNPTVLSREFWSFSVWVPLLILAYPVVGLVIMLRYRNNYKKWCENNYASMENIDVKWLEDYIFSNFIFTLSCQVVVFSDNVRSVLMHNIIFLVFFLYGFYRVLFQKSPYPEGYFKAGMDDTKAEIRELIKQDEDKQEENRRTDVLAAEDSYNQHPLFTNKLPEYSSKLEQWMQSEKPYLRKDFKLTDAMKVLPLNRSYLSRLFNEGYGETFYQFVMRYRIAESKHLLLSHPELPITRIADLSGFSSASVFCRAFAQETNYSPTHWREKEMFEIPSKHQSWGNTMRSKL